MLRWRSEGTKRANRSPDYHPDRPTALDDEAGLRNRIGTFAAKFLESIPEEGREEILEEVEEELREAYFREGRWVAPYRRLRFVAVRELR